MPETSVTRLFLSDCVENPKYKINFVLEFNAAQTHNFPDWIFKLSDDLWNESITGNSKRFKDDKGDLVTQ
uniref:Uncharacterized protein n=1 Tax=Romanomermis culicivorax TaxID=13658 RepID=A0A915JT73_ROMCU